MVDLSAVENASLEDFPSTEQFTNDHSVYTRLPTYLMSGNKMSAD
jgi:hypothetical protein